MVATAEEVEIGVEEEEEEREEEVVMAVMVGGPSITINNHLRSISSRRSSSIIINNNRIRVGARQGGLLHGALPLPTERGGPERLLLHLRHR